LQYFLNEQQETVRSLARRIAEERILPVRAELDEREEFPWNLMHELANADMFRVFIPGQYGGLDGGILDLCLAVEELSRVCGGVAVSYAANALGVEPLLGFGTPEQKQRFLPDVADGKRLAAFAITESVAGSDASAIQTTAIRDGDSYVVNGSKQFITNGGEAEIYSMVVVTDHAKGSRGASVLVIEKGTPGFTFGKKETKLGIRSSATRELVFHNCRVPKDNLVGREGMGYIIALKTFDRSRPCIGAQAVGIAQGAFEAAVEHARTRLQFGKPISSLQAIQHMLADMATDIEAARALVYVTARGIDGGDKAYTEASAMAKLFASDMAMRVTTNAVQVLGGSGYMRDYPVEKMMRDAKITQIYEGTNQVMRNVIAIELLKRRGKHA